MNEFDTRRWNNAVLNFFFRGASRNLILIAAVLLALVMFARMPGRVWTLFVRWLETRSGVLMCLAGVFWVLGGATDKSKPFNSDSANLLVEEAMEVNAALLMIFSTLVLLRTWRLLWNTPSSQNPSPAISRHQ
jgi:hypothetical protein